MAEPKQITAWAEAGDYLQMLRNTVGNDIRPLLDTAGGAPFAIFREVMSYIDHLGNLYSTEKTVGERFARFLRDVSAEVDSNYAMWATQIYDMYRCGPVHEFCPKILKNDHGQRLDWFSYRGSRKNQNLELDGRPIIVSHLEPLHNNGTSVWWLPVSSECLVEDLEKSIDTFAGRFDHAERISAWNLAAKRLGKPQPSKFSL